MLSRYFIYVVFGRKGMRSLSLFLGFVFLIIEGFSESDVGIVFF